MTEHSRPLPIKWVAPESLMSNKYGPQSDVWSFGIVLHELFSFGAEPYKGMPIVAVLQAVREGYRMPQPPACPDAIYALMTRCWDVIPEKRPSFRAIYTELNAVLEALENSLNNAANAYSGEYFYSTALAGGAAVVASGLPHSPPRSAFLGAADSAKVAPVSPEAAAPAQPHIRPTQYGQIR